MINNKKLGFTLAEILITLGVIGVVAALTLPALITNYQRKVWVTQLQKEYSMLNQGFAKMLADEGVTKLEDTSLFSTINTQYPYSHSPWYVCELNTNSDDCNKFYKDLKKYFNFTIVDAPKTYVPHNLAGSGDAYFVNTDNKLLIFSDGSMLIYAFFEKEDNSSLNTSEIAAIKNKGGHMFGSQGHLTIDVNGLRKPNKYGRDIFVFEISSDGKLYPYEGFDYALYSYAGRDGYENRYWKKNEGYSCGTYGSPTMQNNTDGWACAARIMEENWEMNYNDSKYVYSPVS